MNIVNPINILVQRRAAIGDVIMTTGVVRELKRLHPEANIDVATDNFEVYVNNPYVRHVVSPDGLKVSDYQIYVNLDDAYELNPENNYVDSYFYRAFGKNFTGMDQHVELFPTAQDQEKVQQDRDTWASDYIVVHMRNWHWAAKNISMDVWFDVFAKLFEQRTDFKVVCVGGSTDHVIDHPLFIDARARYSIQELKCLMDHARCFVGIDSAPYWAAAASETTVIGLFTHLLPERILPQRHCDSTWHTVGITTEESCRGCNDRQARPVRFINCEHGNYPCTSNFNAQAIADTILDTLDKQ